MQKQTNMFLVSIFALIGVSLGSLHSRSNDMGAATKYSDANDNASPKRKCE
jgi:hypothetical protein